MEDRKTIKVPDGWQMVEKEITDPVVLQRCAKHTHYISEDHENKILTVSYIP